MRNRKRPKQQVQDIGIPVETEESLPPDLEGAPIPDELTGRASKTSDDLEALFENENEEHLKDGFRGGSGDEPDPIGPPADLDAPRDAGS